MDEEPSTHDRPSKLQFGDEEAREEAKNEAVGEEAGGEGLLRLEILLGDRRGCFGNDASDTNGDGSGPLPDLWCNALHLGEATTKQELGDPVGYLFEVGGSRLRRCRAGVGMWVGSVGLKGG